MNDNYLSLKKNWEEINTVDEIDCQWKHPNGDEIWYYTFDNLDHWIGLVCVDGDRTNAYPVNGLRFDSWSEANYWAKKYADKRPNGRHKDDTNKEVMLSPEWLG